MSKESNISPSNSVDIGHVPQQIRKHDRSDLKRLHNLRLPTPPPDPTLSVSNENTNVYEESYQKQTTEVPNKETGQETILKEIEFLEYLSSLSIGYQQSSKTDSSSSNSKNPLLARTNSVFSQVVATEDAFDHLDKLYKLMEQLLNLREQNSRLQKRVRDLEHFKMLQEMHMRVEQDFTNSDERLMFQDLESDPVYAESLLDTMLAAGRNASNKRNLKLKSLGGPHSRFRQSILRKGRDRSSSVAIDEITPAEETSLSEGYLRIPYFDTKPRRASTGITLESSSIGKPSKVSKWTKVKAAFKWEKASPTVNGTTLPGAKSQDSGIGGMLPTNNEVARYLRVPSIVGCHGSSSGGVSPADSVLSGQSSHGLTLGGNQNSVSPSVDLSIPATPGSLSSASSIEDVNATEESLARSRETSHSEKLLHQRLSTCSDEEDLREQQRRSKSYDEDITLGSGGELSPHFNKDDDSMYYRKNWPNKLHKTPWGKVKDIIQTRKDSLRKSRNRSSIKLDDNFSVQDKYNFTQSSTPVERCRSGSSADVCSVLNEQNDYPEVFEPPSVSKEIPVQNTEQVKSAQKTENRQTPTLTVTIPQTNYENVQKKTELERKERERRSLRASENKQTKNTWRKSSTHDGGLPQEVVRRYQEIIAKDKEHSGKQSLILSNDEVISDTETSPQTPRRNSRWTFVKKAFLSKTDEENSEIPSSPKSAFEQSPSLPISVSQRNIPTCTEFSANKDDLTNLQTKRKLQQELSYPQSNRKLQEEIRKNYEELQNKLSLEFQEKLQEWERMKCSNYPLQNQSNIGSASTSSAILDTHNQQTCPDTEFQKKIDEWERMKQNQTGFSKVKEQPTTPLNLTSEENLSADFRKKLQEWERMKKLGTVNKEDHMSTSTGNASSIVHSSSTKKKITDWQFFKSSGGQGNSGPLMRNDTQRQLGPPDTKQLSEDFLKKLEEWKHMKATNTVPSYTVDDDERYKMLSGNKTPSPDVQRKDSSGIVKIPRQSTKKIKTQEEKELQWLEKELQKIEREKQRLEREREKFLEREERLAKLRRSIGNNHQKKEVLVQTSTGFFRFEGISRKFTQRLYEWEKARGIGPEESTLMLLNPGYRPTFADNAKRVRVHKDLPAPNIKLTRSKSVDSVANFTQSSGLNLVSSPITHHASSLSLNDMEELEAQCLADSRMSSDPDRLHDPDEEDAIPDYNSDKEPEAMIVDVEDVVVETAAPLEPIGRIKDVTHTPVYKVTQQEFDTMCEMQKCIAPKVQESVSADTQSTYYLIEEILSHLQKVIAEENVCQQLENKIDELNEKCNTITIIQNKEMEKLWKEARIDKSISESTKIQAKSKIKELQQKKKRLKQEGVIIMNSFIEHCSWQDTTVQNIVKLIRNLQEACNIALSNASDELYTDYQSTQESFLEDVKEKVQDLSTELVSLAEQLQILYTDRKKYAENVYKKLKNSDFAIPPLHNPSSADSATYSKNSQLPFQIPQISPEEKELPVLLNSKVLELKRLSSYLCAASDMTPPGRGKKNITNQLKTEKTLPLLKTDLQPEIETLESDEQKPKTPVTNVTITPKFLKKSKHVDSIEESDKIVSKSITVNEEAITSDRNDIKTDVTYAQVNIPLNTYSEEVEHKFVVNIYADKQESPKNRNGSNGATKRKLKTRPKVDIKLKEDSCSDEENSSNDTKKCIKARKLIRTKRIPSESPKTDDGNIQVSEKETISKSKTSPSTKNEDQVFSFCKDYVPSSNVIVSTCNQFVELVENNVKKPESPVEIFVKTTRKLFTPIVVDSSFIEKSVKEETNENEESEEMMISEIPENDEYEHSINICTTPYVVNKNDDKVFENTTSEVICVPLKSVERKSLSESPVSKRKVCFTDPPDLNNDVNKKEEVEETQNSEKNESNKQVVDENLDKNAQEINKFNNEREKKEEFNIEKIFGTKNNDSETVIKPSITQTSSLPPLPHSPIPSRRDRIPFKETAPSIRLMIARYNQRLSEQDGGKSPGGSSGSASPVAWRSPVAERRVRAQTERYQEEIKRVLQQDGGKYSPRRLGREIMKSASAGVIRSNEIKRDGSIKEDPLRRSSADTQPKGNVISARNPNKLLKGILKSSSASSIKSEQNIKKYDNAPYQFLNEMAETSKRISEIEEKVEEKVIKENESKQSEVTIECATVRIQNTLPRIVRKNDGKSLYSKEDVLPSTELTLNSPLSKIRALKIQKAKEEFLTRQVSTNESISSQTKTDSSAECNEEQVRIADNNRLSQVSYGSESSYDDCNIDGVLVKSASAGMINVDADTYHKLSSSEQHTDGYVSLPRASKSTKDVPGSRFGIGSITSKFRKVKMRRNKEKDGKMNTISMLCRQSLFVDLNDSGNNVHGRNSSLSVEEASKSVSVSPVLQRQSSSSGKEQDTNSPSSSSASSWIKKTKIFKSK